MTTRPRLTDHQKHVLLMIERYNRTFNGTGAPAWAVGCRSACIHLTEKGYVREETVTGPRGGTSYLYHPVAEVSA